MRLRLAISVPVLLSLIAISAAAAKPPAPEVRFSFDREQFTAGEPFEINIAVSTEGEGDPEIRIPSFQGLEVLQKSVSRPSSAVSFSFSFGTGGGQKVVRNSGTAQYQFVVLARQPGEIRVGPVEVTLDGYTFKSASKVIRINAAGAVPQVAPDAADAAITGDGGASTGVLKNVRIDPDYFLHMETSKDSVVQGEMLILSVYLYTSKRGIRIEQFVREPGTDGFWVERFEDFDPRQPQTDRVVVENQLYDRVLLKKLALFPVKSGDLVIAPAVFSFSVGGGFFSVGQSVKRAAQPVTIKVRPCPDVDRPADFNSFNVGKYQFEARADRDRVKTGDPVTVNLTLSGDGNVRNAVLPAFEEISGLKFYAPEDSSDVRAAADRVSGSRRSKWLIIAEKPGDYTLPGLSVSVFDPTKGAYTVLRSQPIAIHVDQGAGGGVAVSSEASGASTPSQNDALGRMTAKLRSVTSRINVSRRNPLLMEQPWYLAVVIGVPFLFAAFMIGSVVRSRVLRRRNSDRSRRADALAVRQLRDLTRHLDGGTRDVFFARLQKIILTFLELRLDAAVAGDTMPELSARMSLLGFQESLITRTVAFLESCEFARFARSSGEDRERRAEIDRAIALVEALSVQTASAPSREGGFHAAK